jgi:hemolysin III
MEHCINNSSSFAFPDPLPRHKKKSAEKPRDPYDGLRPWSAITHGTGAVLGILGTILLILRAAGLGGGLRITVFAVYGFSMILLYTASTLYHCLNTSVAARIALRKYDHCSIYLLIAGSYTPICVAVLEGRVGLPLLTGIWALAAAGITLTIGKGNIPRVVSSVIYLVMGWLAVFAIVPLYRSLSAAGFFWLLAGGILYTIGGVLYALKWPGRNNPRFGCHEIFHVFILLGSVCHFFVMTSSIL